MGSLTIRLLGRQDRLARQAPHGASFLVGHQEQRQVHRVERACGRLLQFTYDRGQVRLGPHVLAEKDDPGYLAVPYEVEQPGWRRQAAIAIDHSLACELERSERGQERLRDRNACGAGRDGARTQSEGR